MDVARGDGFMQSSGSGNGTDHISTSAMQVTASALKRDASRRLPEIRALLVPQLHGQKADRAFSYYFQRCAGDDPIAALPRVGQNCSDRERA